MPRLGTDAGKQAPLLLPPLNEQKRIVAAIEALRERSQKARLALAAIPELCDKFRQSVLAAAFQGDLTADWREQNPSVESGINRWKVKSLPLESTNLPKIPESWLYRKLDEVSGRVSVGHVGPTSEYYCDSTTGVPFLRSQNVRPGRLNLTGLQYITKDFHEQLRNRSFSQEIS
jgi:type I restriction enzyme S subunit